MTLLQALALEAHADRDRAVSALLEALGARGIGRIHPQLCRRRRVHGDRVVRGRGQGRMTGLVRKLLPLFQAEPQPRIDALSQREIEVLGLIAQGLPNQEISGRLFLALDTVKGHNRKIFGKLQVQRRTEAVARARELGLA